jgi:hypothetical protein
VHFAVSLKKPACLERHLNSRLKAAITAVRREVFEMPMSNMRLPHFNSKRLLHAFVLVALAASAIISRCSGQTAEWKATPSNGNWLDPQNWNPTTSWGYSPANNAIFGNSSQTAISLTNFSISVGTIQFGDNPATPYRFTISSGSFFLSGPVTNESSKTPVFDMSNVYSALQGAADLAPVNVSLGSGASLDFSGLTSAGASIGALSGTGALNSAGINLGGKTVSVGGLGLDSSFPGQVYGNGAFTKVGSGTLTLTGQYNTGAPINAMDGSVFLNGTINNRANVVVAGGATLGGSGGGQADITMNPGSFLEPGSAAGAIGTLSAPGLRFIAGRRFPAPR